MDTTLLQKRAGDGPAHTERPDASPKQLTPNESDGALEVTYEDLPIEPPAPPVRVHLEPAVEYDGKAYHELIFDFDALIGKDFQTIERTFSRMYRPEKNEVVMMWETKHLGQALLAAHVADVPVGLIMKLPRRFYIQVRMRCLKACGSSPDEENE